MIDFYYTEGDGTEVAIQAIGNNKFSIRVSDKDETSMIELPANYIDKLIKALEKIKIKVKQ